MLSFISFFLYDVLVLMYLYSFITSRGRASLRIPVALFNSFVARPRPLLSRSILMHLLSDSRRIYVALRFYRLMRRSALAFSRISLFSVETLHYLLSRRASRARVYPRAAAVFMRRSSFFFLSARQPRSLARNPLCCSRLANTTRSANLHSRRLPYTSLGGGECGGYLLVLARVPRCRAPHILIDANSPIYILLLNIFSPRVTRVTRQAIMKNASVNFSSDYDEF